MISVSILGVKEDEVLEKIDKLDCEYIHLDIMDNKFVTNYNEYDNNYKFKKNIDIHLMVSDVKSYIEKYKELNPKYMTFHIETEENILELINLIKTYNIKAGLALNPNTKIDRIKPYLEYLDLVLVMSVNPGYGGQQYIEESTNKINELYEIRKENNYNFLIEVDGGINNETFIKANKADIKVVGSFITKSSNMEENLSKLK